VVGGDNGYEGKICIFGVGWGLCVFGFLLEKLWFFWVFVGFRRQHRLYSVLLIQIQEMTSEAVYGILNHHTEDINKENT
jgi:hypothetical protein